MFCDDWKVEPTIPLCNIDENACTDLVVGDTYELMVQ